MSTYTQLNMRHGESFLTRVQGQALVRKVNAFLYSPRYMPVVGLATLAANFFGAELIVYSLVILFALYLSLCGRDYLPLMPVVVCCYISPSVANNPGSNPQSIFYPQNGGIFLLVLAGLFLASLIWRIAVDPDFGGKKFFTCKRSLLPGMLVLGAGYLLGGLGSGWYFAKGAGNLIFAALQFVSLFVLYYVFTGAVKWKEVPRNYFAWTAVCVGLVLVSELLFIFATTGVIVNGTIQRGLIFTGWGHYNNIGGMLVMMLPFAFQLACRKKRSWLWILCSAVLMVGILLTCSRSAIFVGAAIYMAGCLLFALKGENKRSGLVLCVVIAAGLVVALVLFQDKLYHLFRNLINKGLDPSNRIEIYQAGLKQFLENPVFGAGFFPTDYAPYAWSSVEAFNSFFPPRWHNTLIQMLASCGCVGLIAYLFHRFQTVVMLIKKPTVEKCFIALSVLALVLTSMLDCHFFNIGPVLFYSMSLAFAEKYGTEV